MDEHPQYRMWQDRLDREHAIEQAHAERRAARELAQAHWYAAWVTYKARRDESRQALPRPRWWNVVGWIRWLLRLHAPGRPG